MVHCFQIFHLKFSFWLLLSQLCHLLAVEVCLSYLISLRRTFHFCKTGDPLPGCCENEHYVCEAPRAMSDIYQVPHIGDHSYCQQALAELRHRSIPSIDAAPPERCL